MKNNNNDDMNNNKIKSKKSKDKPIIADPNLPSNKSDIPNWFPDPGSMSWADEAVDSNEWSNKQRNELKNQFIPEPQFQHLFEAVQMPPRALEAINHPITKEYDNANYLKRSAIETYLYNANSDITTCLRPLLEVISNLADFPEQNHNRVLLGVIFQGLSSASIKISRGRRELARRFVPKDNVHALYRTSPSHKSFFGGDSNDNAVEAAVKDSKTDKSLVIMPRRNLIQNSIYNQFQPFRNTGFSGMGFQGLRYRQFNNPQFQQFNPYNQRPQRQYQNQYMFYGKYAQRP